MSRKITVAAIQTSYASTDMDENIAKTNVFVERAAARGAQVILPSELFQGPYFCSTQDKKWFETALPADKHPCVIEMQKTAKRLGVAIPISFFEESGGKYYNSLAMADADGKILGVYRKTHIPHNPGYEEQFYFKPGDTGFKVWDTKFGKIGVGICWDQWFPEAARMMALQGAEILMYPTAIGSEPSNPKLDTSKRWRRAQQGHAASNVIPVVASNRIGHEEEGGVEMNFYGHSFITDQSGALVESFGAKEEGVLTHTFDLDLLEVERQNWAFPSFFRPEFYKYKS
jgi:N-carbamoylputrescine amidase